MNKLMKRAVLLFPILSLTTLFGCAAGAATAGYALKAQSADSLTVDGEQRIIDRAKREVFSELSGNNPNMSNRQ